MNLEKLFETIYKKCNQPAETRMLKSFQEIYFECNVKPVFEQILREMANIASRAMANFIDEFYYEVSHTLNFRKKTTEPFDPKNFPVTELIRKIYEAHCGDEFLRFIEPPEEDRWLQQVIIELRAKQNSISNYHRQSYAGLINHIEQNNLLRTVLDEVKTAHQQATAQIEHSES
jgi:hypothetical protein